MASNGKAIFLGKLVIVFAWTLLLSLTLLVVGEQLISGVRAAKDEERKHLSKKPRMAAIRAAYEPFRIKSLHPFYLFYFPPDTEGRLGNNNQAVSVDDRGFRDTPSEDARGRKIAVLLGGSTAFGHYASSNETTITGYLNALQDRYWFLNGGVGSWNSTQELSRLVNQVVEMKPALVLTLDGANDAIILQKYWERGYDYPPGTPESFESLSRMVADIESGELGPGVIQQSFKRLFPEWTRILEKQSSSKYVDLGGREIPPDDLMQQAAAKYLLNLNIMRQVSEANGARFIAIFQPIRSLHRNVPSEFKKPKREKYFRAFHDDVLRAYSRQDLDLEFHDFATLFDEEFDEVPVYYKYGEADLDDEMIFVDSVHLLDRGNQIAARRIWSLVEESGNRD